jgi:anaerobic selenocysteine-containing dehydrogenase
MIYNPDRLKTPLIRVGERGEGKWREATWDEALDFIAQKMIHIRDTYGPESMLLFNQVVFVLGLRCTTRSTWRSTGGSTIARTLKSLAERASCNPSAGSNAYSFDDESDLAGYCGVDRRRDR